jgi:RNA polymerase sigma-70 factor (ECF subfamily)
MSTDVTDGELLVRIGEGDADAFTMLWRRLSGPVLALGRRMLGDDAAGEDVAQETFATIWRVAATYDPERGAPSGWIFTIARNAARDVARRRRMTILEDAPDTADPGLGPDDQALRSAERFRIHVALASLNPRAREVIELAYFQGLTQSEIAERIDVPLGTVKTRTRNALARLAESLAPAETL